MGREVKAARAGVAESRRQLTEVQDMIAVDPTGFASEHLPKKTRTEVAMHLLFEPGVLEAIEERLRASGHEGGLLEVLDDPQSRRRLAAESRAQRLEVRDALRQQHQRHRAMQASAGRVMEQVEQLIPDTITGERRRQLFGDSAPRASLRRQTRQHAVRPSQEGELGAAGPTGGSTRGTRRRVIPLKGNGGRSLARTLA